MHENTFKTSSGETGRLYSNFFLVFLNGLSLHHSPLELLCITSLIVPGHKLLQLLYDMFTQQIGTNSWKRCRLSLSAAQSLTKDELFRKWLENLCVGSGCPAPSRSLIYVCKQNVMSIESVVCFFCVHSIHETTQIERGLSRRNGAAAPCSTVHLPTAMLFATMMPLRLLACRNGD